MKNKDEIDCLTCDGAGMITDKGAMYGVRLCPGCNGHGVVLVHCGKVIKFDVDSHVVVSAKIG